MGWFIVGLAIGAAGLWLKSWACAKNISITWYAWVFIVLAALVFALTAMDSQTLNTEMEPGAAAVVPWLYGIPGVVLALIAVGLVWWQNRQRAAAPTQNS